jgi:hypothetical protein
MTETTRSHLLHSLGEWRSYVDTFKRLAPDRQAGFLHEQGFAALQDLLGHVAGWWDEGLRVVKEVQADPSFIYLEPDTDTFNAELVRKFQALTETDALTQFETTRVALRRLVEDLPEEILEHALVRDWLFADVIEHLEEHRLPD